MSTKIIAESQGVRVYEVIESGTAIGWIVARDEEVWKAIGVKRDTEHQSFSQALMAIKAQHKEIRR